MGTTTRPRSSWFAAALAASTAPSFGRTFTTDASRPGTPFSPGVRGQPIPAVTINRGEYSVGVPKALELARGSSLRGVAGGLEADTFNWKTRNNSPRAGTLDYLRHSRDNNANLLHHRQHSGPGRARPRFAGQPAVLRHEHPDARDPRRRLGPLHEPHRAELPPGADRHRRARPGDPRLANVEQRHARRQLRQASRR